MSQRGLLAVGSRVLTLRGMQGQKLDGLRPAAVDTDDQVDASSVKPAGTEILVCLQHAANSGLRNMTFLYVYTP